MRGRRTIKKRISVDYKFSRPDIAKFTNYIMERGKKSVAESIVYGALEIISQKTKKDALEVFEKAIKNISPIVEVKSRRIGGANYQVPVEVKPERQFTLACRWLIGAARAKKGKKMRDKIAFELMEAANSQGDAFRKKEDVYRMAEANRAFAHFA